MNKLDKLERQITVLAKKRERLEGIARKQKINKVEQLFLNAEWILGPDFQLMTTNLELAKLLNEFDDICWDFDLTTLFGQKPPFTHLGATRLVFEESPRNLTISDSKDDEDSFQFNGIILCEIKSGACPEDYPYLKMVLMLPVLKEILPHFKNLRPDCARFAEGISRIQAELTSVSELVLEKRLVFTSRISEEN
jgi:hypothetical protein